MQGIKNNILCYNETFLVFSTAFVISLALYLRKMGLRKMRLMKNSSLLNAFTLNFKTSAA